MNNVCTIYRREIGAYFNSPIAYIFIVLFIAFMAFWFFIQIGFFKQSSPNVLTYYQTIPWVFAVFIPAVTMRLWAEEKRAGTIELLMTMPIESWQVVLAKYLASFTVIALSLLVTVVVPLTGAIVTDVDSGVVFSTYVGCMVIASVYIALGAWVSTFTHNQIVALLVAVFCSFILSFLGFPNVIKAINDVTDTSLGNFVGWFGTFYHWQEFTRGLINPVGLIYSVGLTAFFLTLNNVFVEGRKF
ncbi:MAG: ABC transporter permease subunit [Planctomycetota bacterium]|nr:ABC transporter permease subunit [Planctomycetota bacterium]